jgi:hypothetical protein
MIQPARARNQRRLILSIARHCSISQTKVTVSIPGRKKKPSTAEFAENAEK